MRCFVSPRRALCVATLCAAWLLCGAAEAAACSCLTVRPCQAFADADAVFVGTVAAQSEREQPEKPGDPNSFVSRVQVSKFHVEEVFAGLAGAREVEIETDLSTSCSFSLRHGTRYVVYAFKAEGADAGRLSTHLCSRTSTVEDAAEDLAYLREAAASKAGAALVEGEVSYAGGGGLKEVGADTVGVTTVVAEGAGRRAEARVGAGGRYQFKNLPPGKYRLTVPLPEELTVLDPYRPELAADLGIKDQHEIDVPGRGCVVRHIMVADNGRISGRVTDAAGAAVAGIEVGLLRLGEDGAPSEREEDEDLYAEADDDGNYAFKALPPGRYLIGVRLGPYLSNGDVAAAYPRTFYPGVADEREAIAVSLGRGQSVTRRDFQAGPRLRERTVRGVVVRRDGRAAAGVKVRYQARTPDRKLSTPELLKTDARGRFSFTAYEGAAYLVGAVTADCAGPECLHAHDALVGAAGTPRPLRLVLDQPGSSCERCRDYDEFQKGKR